ncbi:hypothetical protein DFH08DRAFT_819929 [Mycena albidolilacea]|uniref:Uncharacterized protein n=1 Tax=Mycena albidolilacea TaxID=1033008 RepID=A0AAD7EF06_9AGAR|nr:hypothetical protein DFH08DRAFT_819929 [Mycena albidolilacea]
MDMHKTRMSVEMKRYFAIGANRLGAYQTNSWVTGQCFPKSKTCDEGKDMHKMRMSVEMKQYFAIGANQLGAYQTNSWVTGHETGRKDSQTMDSKAMGGKAAAAAYQLEAERKHVEVGDLSGSLMLHEIKRREDVDRYSCASRVSRLRARWRAGISTTGTTEALLRWADKIRNEEGTTFEIRIPSQNWKTSVERSIPQESLTISGVTHQSGGGKDPLRA